MAPDHVPFTDNRWLRAEGLFVAEGRFIVRRVLALPGWRVRRVLVTPVARDAAGIPALVDALPPGRRPSIEVLAPEMLDAAGGVRFHQGCVALVDRPRTTDIAALDPAGLAAADPGAPDAEAPTGGASRVVVLEAVRDPDNVGAIARSALAFGARALLLGPGCADPLYRKTVRTSMGTILSLPFAEATPWPDALDVLRDAGFSIVALTPDPAAEPLAAAAAALASRPTALVLGSEGEGLSPGAIARADRRVRIPTAPVVDSLNVAMTAAIALYALTGPAVVAGEGDRR
ncbi:MAG: RNA methyltransferase [Vicinamibacterales bacterium]